MSALKKRLVTLINFRPQTLLCVGPMSKNCVDATIELANEYDRLLMMIASRRQIDSKDLGGGYVEKWSTENFSNYVHQHDKKGNIILCRDHGGPWQGIGEEKYSYHDAMARAKQSYEADIKSGISLIHIDPSIDPYKTLSVDESLVRIYELIEFCWNKSKQYDKDIVFEIGTEEQDSTNGSLDALQNVLVKIKAFCSKNTIPAPLFLVVQTGTKVVETYNVGSFDTPYRIEHELPAEVHIPKVLKMIASQQLYLKQHNTDYLSDASLAWMPRLGIHSSNVAPEFGVVETKALLALTSHYDLKSYEEKFLDISYQSNKWKKWMLPNTTASDYQKAIISGHYVFSDSRVKTLFSALACELRGKGVELNTCLKTAVKESILRYMKLFRMI